MPQTVGGGNGDLPTHGSSRRQLPGIERSEHFPRGAAASVRPEDFEIRRNHLFSRCSGTRTSPDHQEPTPIVKESV